MNNDLKQVIIHLIILFFAFFTWCIILGARIEKIEQQLNKEETPQVKELIISVSGSIAIEQPVVSVNSVGENTVGMGERSIYADMIDELNDEEKIMICQITFREAGNQSVEGKRAVIEVILNRVKTDVQPDTVELVLSQPRQFMTWAGRNSVSQNDIDNIMTIIENEVYTEDPILPTHLVEPYVYFNSNESPGVNNAIKIGDHWFGTR